MGVHCGLASHCWLMILGDMMMYEGQFSTMIAIHEKMSKKQYDTGLNIPTNKCVH